MDYHRLQSSHAEGSSRQTILFVDDHMNLRDSIAVLLELEGYDVIDAANGGEALKHLSSASGQNVGAIVLDLTMPVMDGWQFLAECRKSPAFSEIPTIVVTGVSDARRRSKELGDLAVFTNPFHFDELIREIRRALDGRKNTKRTVLRQ